MPDLWERSNSSRTLFRAPMGTEATDSRRMGSEEKDCVRSQDRWESQRISRRTHCCQGDDSMPEEIMVESTQQISDDWRTVNWPQVERTVFRLQQRIYRASQRGDTRMVQSLQRLLSKSWSARMLAVRRVTQENKGKKTAGTDGIASLKAPERIDLAKNLDLDGKSDPVRRVLIPKPGKSEYRKVSGLSRQIISSCHKKHLLLPSCF